MCELRADGPTVDLPQLRDHVLELHPRGDRIRTAAGEELAFEIRLGESEVPQLEYFRRGALHQAQRIDVRQQMASVAVNLDEPRYSTLLSRRLAPCRARSRD